MKKLDHRKGGIQFFYMPSKDKKKIFSFAVKFLKLSKRKD